MKTQFTKPVNLNGAQLVSELATAGVPVTGYPIVDGNRNFWLDIDPTKTATATAVVNAHIGLDPLGQPVGLT